MTKILSHVTCIFPDAAEQGEALTWVSSHPGNKRLSYSLFGDVFFCVAALFPGDFTVLNGPQLQCFNAASVPTHKMARCALWTKLVLDKLHSGLSYMLLVLSSMLMNQLYIY